MNENSSERRKSSRTGNSTSSQDRGPENSVESNQPPSNLTLTRQILSKQESANKSLDTTQSVRIDPLAPLPADLNEIMEGADQDLLTFINVNSAAILQHIADSVSVSHQSLLETAAAESAPNLDVQEEKKKKPPKTKEEKEKGGVEEVVEKFKIIGVVHPVTTTEADNSDEETTKKRQQPERERQLDLDNQPTAQPSTSGETRSRPRFRIVRTTPRHPPVIMPVVRRSATAEARKAETPEEDDFEDEISEKIDQNIGKSEEELEQQAAAFVAMIRTSTIQKIAESRSQGTQVSNIQRAAQESEILRYVETTSDTSALQLLRDPPQEAFAKRQKKTSVPPPNKRTGPPPPWAPRNAAARRAAVENTSEALPRWNYNGPSSARNQSLKRTQPYQGHAVDNNIPRKMQKTDPRGESKVVSRTTSMQLRGHHQVNHNVQAQEPRRENPKKAPIPAGVNSATPCIKYSLPLNPGKPMFRGMQNGHREREARNSLPAQRIQPQPPVGQVVRTLPLNKNVNGSVVVSNVIRTPEKRQVIIEPPNSSNGMQTGSQSNKSPQSRVVNPVPNAASTQNSPNVQNSIRIGNNQQTNAQVPTEKELVPYSPQKSVPYVPSSQRRELPREFGTKSLSQSNDNPLSDPSDAPSDPAPLADQIPNGKSEAEKNRDEHIAMAKEIKQEAIEEEEAKKGTVEKVAAPTVAKVAAPAAAAKVVAPAAVAKLAAPAVSMVAAPTAVAMVAAPAVAKVAAPRVSTVAVPTVTIGTAPAVVDHSPPAASVPVRQSFKPASMPGLITPKSLFNGVYQGPKEQFRDQLKKGQQQMKQVTDEIVANEKKQLEENANFQQPIKVIWKNRSINLPEYMRCELCKGLMGLWMEVHNARKNYSRLFPAYKCKACPSVRSIASKFDLNEEIAESAWPSVKINSPVKIVQDFDLEMDRLLGPNFVEREEKKKQEKARKLAEQRHGKKSRSSRNLQEHLSENFCCGRLDRGASEGCTECNPEAREAMDSIHSDSITSPTSDPQIDVAQEVENPRMSVEIANIITKKVEVGDTSSYSMHQLVQKILVVSGLKQSEDAPFDPEVMHEISANEFMETMTTFLMSQNGFPKSDSVKDD